MLDAPLSNNDASTFPPGHSGHAGVHETPVSSGKLKLVGAVALGVLLVVVVVGATGRMAANKDLTAVRTEAAIPTVNVVQPQSNIAGSLVLPGRLQAWSEAPVYARTNGYLLRWRADIGDHVKSGQVLADIDTPDVDQQLAAATAALATADAQRSLAATTSERWDRLVKVHAVSQQEADQDRGALAARQAQENEARANVKRLQTLTDFKHIVAPFDGVVTSRSTDIGALIVAGDARATPLFSVADTSRLRLYVSVPQSYASAIKSGTTASFTVPDRPGQTFTAQVVRLAGAVNAQSGAMLIQLIYDNKDDVLKPGAYAQVDFKIPQAAKVAATTSSTIVRIPSSALLFRKEGTAVAVVDGNGVVSIRPVQIAQDFGAELAIGSGITSQDQVVDNPSDAIANGDHVKTVRSPSKAPNA